MYCPQVSFLFFLKKKEKSSPSRRGSIELGGWFIQPNPTHPTSN
jgi:hypothetical protein